MRTPKHSPLLWIIALALLGASPLAAAAPPIDAGKAPGHLIIRAMDANGDGGIDREEFKPLKRGSRLNMFIDADVDENNELTREELDAFLEGQAASRRESLIKRFESEDLNSDGKVTLEEIHDMMFADLDVDGDGKLSVAEVGPERQERRRNIQN